MRRLGMIAIVLAGLLGEGTRAQQAQPPAERATGSYKAEATAVLVDVVVRDRRGNPVIDLLPDEIEIFEDGVRQEIGSVMLYRAPEASAAETPVKPRPAAPEAAPKVRTAPAPPPVIALVFDRLSPDARAMAHRAAMGYVTGEKTDALVGVFGIDLSLKLYQGYTHDAAALRAAIQSVGEHSSSTFNAAAGRSGADALATGTANAMANFQQAASVGGPAAAQAGAAAGGAAPAAIAAEMERRSLETFDVLERDQQGYATSNSLLALVNSMRMLPGRKSIVFFSEGLALPPAVIAQFRSVIDSANRANVSIYTMDAAGLRTESTSKETRDNINAAAARTLSRNPTADVVGTAMTQALEKNEDNLRLDPHSGLNELSTSTGGLLVRNTNNLSAGFRRVDEDMRNYYMVTYVPSNPTFDGKFRTIKVNIKRGGVDVSSRKGYFAVRSAGTPVREFEAPALAMLDATPVPNHFPVRAAAVRFPEPGRPGLTPVIVVVSASSMTFEPRDNQELHGDFTVLVRFRNQADEIVRKVSQQYQFDGTAAQVEEMKRGEVLFYRQVELPPGTYSMETVVYDAVGSRASVRFSTIEQPPAEDNTLRVSNLVLVGRSERLPVSERTADNPFVVGDVLLYPNLGLPLSKSEAKELTFFFTVYPGAAAKPSATLELLQNGKLLAQSPLGLDTADASGRIQQVGRLPLDAFTPGTYDLRVVVSDGQTPQVRSVLVRIAG